MAEYKQKKNDPTLVQTLKKSFKSVDLYGEKIELTYKGEGTYKTNIGAFVSLVLIFILGAYLIYRALVMFTKQGTNVNKSNFIVDLNLEDAFYP
jgi:hypothetical protein